MNTATKEVSAEAPRFEIIGDTVIDHSTGLTWTRGNVPGGRMTQQDAEAVCKKLELGGHTDWRLPTVRELLTLVDYRKHNPTIDTAVFSCDSSWYWTSTPDASSPAVYAWCVGFVHGGAFWSSRGGGGFVRAVRSSQS